VNAVKLDSTAAVGGVTGSLSALCDGFYAFTSNRAWTISSNECSGRYRSILLKKFAQANGEREAPLRNGENGMLIRMGYLSKGKK
jgi:hypothetical protein